MFENNFNGKKQLVEELSKVYRQIMYSNIERIELKKYQNIDTKEKHEFIILHWENGAISTANNNMNSLSATARNIARMLDGGVYENLDFYKQIMTSKEWQEVENE